MRTVLSVLAAAIVVLGATAADERKTEVQLTPEQTAAIVKVGQTVYLGVAVTPGSTNITELKVRINDKEVKVGKDDTKATGGLGIGHFNYVYKAQDPGTYKVVVTPFYGKRSGDSVKYQLKVVKK